MGRRFPALVSRVDVVTDAVRSVVLPSREDASPTGASAPRDGLRVDGLRCRSRTAARSVRAALGVAAIVASTVGAFSAVAAPAASAASTSAAGTSAAGTTVPPPSLGPPTVSTIAPGTLVALAGSIGSSQTAVGGSVSLTGSTGTPAPVTVAHWGPSGLILWIPSSVPAGTYTLTLSDAGGSTSEPLTLTAPTVAKQVITPLFRAGGSTVGSTLPLGVVEDQAGNTWFSDGLANAIDELTAGGVLHQYPLLAADSGPTGIAIDQAGDIWVAQHLTGTVTELVPSKATPGTTDGETEYALAAGSSPDGISVDPFGNVWIAEGSSGILGEVVMSSSSGGARAVRQWEIGGDLEGMLTDAFGNVWVIDESSGLDEIVPSQLPAPSATTLATSGVYPVTTAGGGPVGGGAEQLAIAPNGDVWFTQWGPPTLGVVIPSSVNPADNQVAYALDYPSTGGAPSGIGIDANGTIWVADAESQSVYSFAPQSVDTTTSTVTGTWGTDVLGTWVTNFSEGDEGNNLTVTPAGNVLFTGYVSNGSSSETPYDSAVDVQGYIGVLPGVAAPASSSATTISGGHTTTEVSVGTATDGVTIPAGTTVTTSAGTPFTGTIPPPVPSPSFVPPSSFGTAVPGSAFTVAPLLSDGVPTHLVFSKPITVTFTFALSAGESAAEADASTVWYYDPSTLTWIEAGTRSGDPGGTVTVAGGKVTITILTSHLSSFVLLHPHATAADITSVTPGSPVPGGTVTVIGTNLGSTAGTVTLSPTGTTPGSSVSLHVVSWTVDAVAATVPADLLPGTYAVALTPSGGTVTNALLLTVSSTAEGPAITTSSLPYGNVGSAYLAVLTGSGGGTPYTWSVPAGSLPAGLVLDPTTGVISGTPTADGIFAVPVTVTGAAGGSTTHTFPLGIADGPPSVAVLLPAGGATVSSGVWLDAGASSPIGVTSVRFEVSGGSIVDQTVGMGAPTIDGWIGGMDSTLVPNGTYVLQAVATDAAGTQAVSTGVLITVDNHPLASQVLLPTGGSVLHGSVVLAASSTGMHDVVGTVFVLESASGGPTLIADGVLTPYGWLARWDSTSVPNGTYQLFSVAIDVTGAGAVSAPVSVTVANTTP